MQEAPHRYPLGQRVSCTPAKWRVKHTFRVTTNNAKGIFLVSSFDMSRNASPKEGVAWHPERLIRLRSAKPVNENVLMPTNSINYFLLLSHGMVFLCGLLLIRERLTSDQLAITNWPNSCSSCASTENGQLFGYDFPPRQQEQFRSLQSYLICQFDSSIISDVFVHCLVTIYLKQ